MTIKEQVTHCPYPELAPFFEGHAIKFSTGLNGNRVGSDGTVYIGDGTFHSKSMLAHEMAHFVEIDQRRCGMYGWGLRVPEKFVFDRFCAVPQTTQMAERETRVIAFQTNLLEKLGLFTEEGLVTTIRAVEGFSPDWWLIPAKSDKGRLQWLRRQVNKYRKVNTFELFEAEWWRRSEVLKARMKRKLRAPESLAV